MQERGQRRHVASSISDPAFFHARSSTTTMGRTSQREEMCRQEVWEEQRQAIIDEVDQDHLEWTQEA